ncbi:MAG: glycogen-binding domain-containing protein [Candidatus Eisenbacteria bacterium]
MKSRVALLALALLTAAATSYGGTAKAPGGMEFTYYDPSAYSVSLAGSFNNWDAQKTPMTKDKEGAWRVVVPLASGKYEYKFVVNGSAWMADPDNPRTVGDYGNSALEIDTDGKPVVTGVASAISNTAANARVMLNGWFRGTYTTRKNARPVYGTGTAALGDARWRLSRPAHEMYVSINPTIGSDVKGSVTLRIDSGIGDIREIRTDLYAGRLAFQKSTFDVVAYHNEEALSLDDPMHILGGQDLAGSLRDDRIAFGRGTQGMIGNLRLAGAELQALYSNTYDYDIYNSPIRWRWNTSVEPARFDSTPRYDNVGTDMLALRGKRTLAGVTLGTTYLSKRNGWWTPFEGRNSSPAIDRYRAETKDSASFWFELGTTEWLWSGDASFSPVEPVRVFGEIGRTSYDARWDGGNRVRKQGDQFVDGKIDVPIADFKGSRSKAGLEAAQGNHSVIVTYERIHNDGMKPDQGFITVDALPFEDPDNDLVSYYGLPILGVTEYRNTYIGVQNLDRFILYEQRPLPERTLSTTEVDASTRLKGVDVGLRVDVAKRRWDYPEGDLADYDVTWVRFLPSMAGSLLGERFTYSLAYDRTTDNLSGRMPREFDRGEFILKGGLKIKGNWSLYYNFRRVSYDWPQVFYPAGMRNQEAESASSALQEPSGSDKSFLNPHVALVWSPIPKVEIRLGYGLSPLYYRDTPVEGREIGRERWLSSYLWLDPEANLIEAERALEDLKIISLMGVIAF